MARMVVTTVTVAHLVNAMPAIWRIVAAARSTYELFQVTLSHKDLYSDPATTSVRSLRLEKLLEYFFFVCLLVMRPVRFKTKKTNRN